MRGDPSLPNNPMRYDRVILNLPCMATYDPLLPKVMKWNDLANEGKGAVSVDVVTFVDDVRISGHSKENCQGVHRRFTSRIQYLGMQDAPWKFRPLPHKPKPGPGRGQSSGSEVTLSRSLSPKKNGIKEGSY